MNHTKLVKVSSQPSSGQFVRIWSYGGKVWSDTVRYTSEGNFETYNSSTSTWEIGSCFPDEVKAKMEYFIAEPS